MIKVSMEVREGAAPSRTTVQAESIVDVVRRVAFRPAAFFAGLPRQGNLLSPLVFALICIEVSVILVGLLTFLGVPGGITSLFGAKGNQSFLAFVEIK